MLVHLRFEISDVADYLRQRCFVTLGQFLDALGELLADAVHLAMNSGIERGHPFVVHHQRFYLSRSELGVLSVAIRIKDFFVIFDSSFQF